jgi:hypothetical protein
MMHAPPFLYIVRSTISNLCSHTYCLIRPQLLIR